VNALTMSHKETLHQTFFKWTAILSVLLSSRPGLGLEDTSWKSWPWPWEKSLGKAKSFPHDLCHVVAVRVFSAHTHSVTW